MSPESLSQLQPMKAKLEPFMLKAGFHKSLPERKRKHASSTVEMHTEMCEEKDFEAFL